MQHPHRDRNAPWLFVGGAGGFEVSRPRFLYQVFTLAAERRTYRSRHGLDVVPRRTFAEAPSLQRVVVPGSAPEVSGLAGWAEGRGLGIEPLGSDGFAYDVALRDMARREGASIAAAAAAGLEYPFADAGEEDGWPAGILWRPFALGLLGVGVVTGFDVRRGRRRKQDHDRQGK